MKYEEFEAKRGKLEEKRLEAEGLAQQAQYAYGVVKERHDELTTQRAGAVTEQDRAALEPQVAASADKLRDASQQVRDREATLAAATNELHEFEKERNKAIAESAAGPVITAAHAAHTYQELQHGGPSLEAMKDVVAFEAAMHAFHEKDALITGIKQEVQNVAEKAQGVVEALDAQRLADAQKLEADKAFHSEQLTAVDNLKTELYSQIDASKAEMQKVMGNDWSLAGQKEFAQNEFNSAFQKANDFIAEQRQERDGFFAGNQSVLSPIEQQQNRTAMNEELHAAHYGLTRELAVKQAEINVDLGNKQMEQLEQQRLERKGVPPNELQSAMQPLHRIQEEQRPNDVYTQANKIHAQQSPEMAMNPPSLAPSGPGSGGGAGAALAPQPSGPGGGGAGGGAPQQQGPAGPGL